MDARRASDQNSLTAFVSLVAVVERSRLRGDPSSLHRRVRPHVHRSVWLRPDFLPVWLCHLAKLLFDLRRNWKWAGGLALMVGHKMVNGMSTSDPPPHPLPAPLHQCSSWLLTFDWRMDQLRSGQYAPT